MKVALIDFGGEGCEKVKINVLVGSNLSSFFA